MSALPQQRPQKRISAQGHVRFNPESGHCGKSKVHYNRLRFIGRTSQAAALCVCTEVRRLASRRKSNTARAVATRSSGCSLGADGAAAFNWPVNSAFSLMAATIAEPLPACSATSRATSASLISDSKLTPELRPADCCRR
jgi:hypothetical protein